MHRWIAFIILLLYFHSFVLVHVSSKTTTSTVMVESFHKVLHEVVAFISYMDSKNGHCVLMKKETVERR